MGLNLIHKIQDIFHNASIVNFVIVMKSQLIDNKIDLEEISHPKAVNYRNDG